MNDYNSTWSGLTDNEPFGVFQADTEMESTADLDVSFNFSDGNIQENEIQEERKLEDGTTIIPSKPAWKQGTMDNNEMASDTNLEDEFSDEFWQSLVLDSHLESVPDVDEGQLSPESIDSAISLSSIDAAAPSLDDVFEVLDEIDQFKLSLPDNASWTAQSTHLLEEQSQSYISSDAHQIPTPQAQSPDPCNLFQSFNFDLASNLKSPSRGLVSAVRRLCKLLSEPRSDHLNFVFVRLLNNALKEMEQAVQHQSNRSRRKNGRQGKWPNSKSESDAGRPFEPTSIGMNRSLAFKSQSLSALPTGRGTCADIVDLTGSDGWKNVNFQRRPDSHVIRKESLIALDDTMPDFMQEQFPFVLSI